MSETASFFDKKIIFVVLTTDFWRILFYNADDEIADVRSIWQAADNIRNDTYSQEEK